MKNLKELYEANVDVRESQIPSEWKAYSFKVNFRGQIVKVNVTNLQTTFELEGGEALDIIINDCPLTIRPKILVAI